MGEYDPPQDPPTAPPQPPANPGLPPNEKTLGMVCHLISLVGLIGIPFGNLIGPLVMWLVKKDEMPFVDDQGKESLNFQIFATIIGLVAGVISFLLALTGIGLCLAIPLLMGLGIAWLIFVIIASIAANKGEYYRYPFTIRFIS